jgi:hypothetical protein
MEFQMSSHSGEAKINCRRGKCDARLDLNLFKATKTAQVRDFPTGARAAPLLAQGKKAKVFLQTQSYSLESGHGDSGRFQS